MDENDNPTKTLVYFILEKALAQVCYNHFHQGVDILVSPNIKKKLMA